MCILNVFLYFLFMFMMFSFVYGVNVCLSSLCILCVEFMCV